MHVLFGVKKYVLEHDSQKLAVYWQVLHPIPQERHWPVEDEK